jgi:hypothetical protein
VSIHITGSCHCGAIQYEADVDPALMRVCHCADCQVFSGSAFRVSIRAMPGSLQVRAGTPRVYTKMAESGRSSEQAFCERCGTHVFGRVPGSEPAICSIRVGTIHRRDPLRPAEQIWTRSRLSWVVELGALPGCETQ